MRVHNACTAHSRCFKVTTRYRAIWRRDTLRVGERTFCRSAAVTSSTRPAALRPLHALSRFMAIDDIAPHVGLSTPTGVNALVQMSIKQVILETPDSLTLSHTPERLQLAAHTPPHEFARRVVFLSWFAGIEVSTPAIEGVPRHTTHGGRFARQSNTSWCPLN